jgi:versiconal hemiacetal acetate esterase
MTAHIEDIKVNAKLTVRTYTPTASPAGSNPLPVGVYFHGGGFCCGDLESEDTFCRLLAERLPCIVISVGYRLAPEHKAPTQLDDALEAWNWVSYTTYYLTLTVHVCLRFRHTITRVL